MHRSDHHAPLVHGIEHSGVHSSAGVQYNSLAQLFFANPRQLSRNTAISSSGVAIRITRDARIRCVIPAQAFPSPMNRTARRALGSLRVTTAPILQPSSRNRRPTRPAPMMARLFGIPC
jgi:hypothetical protein